MKKYWVIIAKDNVSLRIGVEADSEKQAAQTVKQEFLGYPSAIAAS